MSLLLDIYNYIWQSGDFPQYWSEATVIPIPKPGKDYSDPTCNSYRPISTIGLVLGPFTALCRSFLKRCTLTNKAVETI